MKTVRICFAVSVALLGCSACAGVTFQRYEGTGADRELKEIGYPLYMPKPHLLVVRNGSKEKPVEVSVIYLPDRTDAGTVYAKFQSGFFGSSNLTMALANGQLTTFGQQSDAKLPELLGGISGMITAQAGADKIAAEAIKLLAEANKSSLEEQGATSFKDIGEAAVLIAQDIKTGLATGGSLAGLTATQREELRQIADAIEPVGKALADPAQAPQAPNNIATLKQLAERLAKFPKSGGTMSALNTALQRANTWASQLAGFVAKGSPEAPSKPDFELYEIKQENGEVKLYLVK